MSIVSGTVGAVMGSNAQRRAAAQNLQATRETNALNRQMFLESRGATGSAVLPMYLRSLEQRLGRDFADAWDATGRPIGEYRERARNYESMMGAARSRANSIFDGGLEREMLDSAAPVQRARVAFKRQSAIDALNKVIADINSAQAGRGYTGDSMGNRMLRFGAERGAADAVSEAELANLEETRGIKDLALQTELGSLDLPGRMAGNELDFMTAGDRAFLEDMGARLQPLTFMRIGAGQPFEYDRPPTVDANASAAQLAMQGISAAGNMALNAWLQNRQQQNWLTAMKSMRAPTPASTDIWSAGAAGDVEALAALGGY